MPPGGLRPGHNPEVLWASGVPTGLVEYNRRNALTDLIMASIILADSVLLIPNVLRARVIT